MNALVVNCSAPHYNLGAAKLSDWLAVQGWTVERCGQSLKKPGKTSKELAYDQSELQKLKRNYDLVCLSVIFSWHAPLARKIALSVKHSSDVWCGGPGIWALEEWWKRETGLSCVIGLDERFEEFKGRYEHTYASRGCPTNCASYCIVPTFEGKDFTLYFDFPLAPILCDNNLSRLPSLFQNHIIKRYEKANQPLEDANSGFEAAFFDEDTYRRWKPLIDTRKRIDGEAGPWRFAFDHMADKEDVVRVLRILKDEPSKSKRVYVLVGNEPIASCYERAQIVLAEGGEPHCQYWRPLNYLGGSLWEKFDWTNQSAIDFCRYFNQWFWRRMKIWDYVPRKDGVAPFSYMRPAEILA